MIVADKAVRRRTTRSLLVSLTAAMVVGCTSVPSASAPPTATPIPKDSIAVSAEGRLEPVRFIAVSAVADGLVSEVLVSEGEQVQAGQVIARLDNTRLSGLDRAEALAAVELSAAYEAVRRAQAKLDDYPLPRAFAGLTAEQAARTWLTAWDQARAEFAPYENTSRKTIKINRWYPHLPRRITVDTGEYDQMAMVYKKRVDVARANYTKATEWLELDAELESARARLALAQQNGGALQDTNMADSTAGVRGALANAEVRSPFAGTVTNLDLEVGKAVQAGIVVATIADFSEWVVKTVDLKEVDVVRVAQGHPVTVTLDAIPGKSFDGRVLAVAQNYAERQGDIVYAVTILLADRHPAMRWGMTAQVTFGQ